MNITTIGKGNVGGGLARRWERAGHQVTTLGSEGGDVSSADVVLVAVPGGAISEALGKVRGLENARALEDFVPNLFGKLEAGRTFYRFAPPGEL